MKKFALVLTLVLAACAGGITVQSVVDWIKSNCGAIVTAVDIAGLITANPGITSAATLGGQVCDAIKLQRAELLKSVTRSESVPTGGVVTVNGVPIHYEVK